MMRLSGLLVLILPALVGAGRVWAGGTAETGPVNPRGTIEYLEGVVLLNGVGAQIGQQVPVGATIATAESSYCEVVFAGRNIFRIEPLTVIRIEIEERRGAIDLREGAVAAVFQKLQRIRSSGGAFRLQTPTAVAGIRGTVFYVRVEDQDNTYICTCNGATRLADIGESFQRYVRADRHKALRFSKHGERITASPAPLLYHDNPSMDALAARIGVRIPWGSASSTAGY
jgi:ferric-dicitrate binding protein FerR (iron transport regulator)